MNRQQALKEYGEAVVEHATMMYESNCDKYFWINLAQEDQRHYLNRALYFLEDKTLIELPCHGIKVILDKKGGGTVESNLSGSDTSPHQDSLFDSLESFILACACEGVDIEDPKFIRAIETTVDAIENH